ncbi:MAG: PD-(D/E)XK nuclease family protein, partial [Bacteroidota bacterium]
PLGNQEVNISGSLDRVDKLLDTQTVRILDYKTGKVALKHGTDMDRIFSDSQHKEMFQGYLYAWLYKSMSPEARVKVGYYTARHLSDGIQFLQRGADITEAELEAFEKNLQILVEDMFNLPYTQTEDVNKCSYCPYNAICNRTTV